MTSASGNSEPEVVEVLTLDGVGARAFLGTLRVATELAARADIELRKAGVRIKASDWDLLALLAIFGELRPSELTAKSSLSGNPRTVSTILNRLEDHGFVTRQALEGDARGVVVALTTAGQELFDEVFPLIITKVVGPFELHFTDDELQTLAAFWSRL